MSFAVPYSKFEQLMDGLRYVRSQGAYRYPVPNLAVLSRTEDSGEIPSDRSPGR
jgi:hypothetical protein